MFQFLSRRHFSIKKNSNCIRNKHMKFHKNWRPVTCCLNSLNTYSPESAKYEITQYSCISSIVWKSTINSFQFGLPWYGMICVRSWYHNCTYSFITSWLNCTLLNTMSKKTTTFRLHDLDNADTKSKFSVSVYIGFYFKYLTMEVFIRS